MPELTPTTVCIYYCVFCVDEKSEKKNCEKKVLFAINIKNNDNQHISKKNPSSFEVWDEWVHKHTRETWREKREFIQNIHVFFYIFKIFWNYSTVNKNRKYEKKLQEMKKLFNNNENNFLMTKIIVVWIFFSLYINHNNKAELEFFFS